MSLMRPIVITSMMACSTVLVGCGGSVGPINGSVRFDDGSPVRSGSIELRRITDRASYASRISVDGTFQPRNQDGVPGVPPGEYEAVVVQIVLTEDLAKELHEHGTTVPRRYADYHTSGLKVTVNESQVDPIEVILESPAD